MAILDREDLLEGWAELVGLNRLKVLVLEELLKLGGLFGRELFRILEPQPAALDAVLALLPRPPQILLSDNGREFETRLAQSLERHPALGHKPQDAPNERPTPSAWAAPSRRPSRRPRNALVHRPCPVQPETGRRAGCPQHPALPSSTRPQNTPILPSSASTRVSKVVDAYRNQRQSSKITPSDALMRSLSCGLRSTWMMIF